MDKEKPVKIDWSQPHNAFKVHIENLEPIVDEEAELRGELAYHDWLGEYCWCRPIVYVPKNEPLSFALIVHNEEFK